MNPEAKIVLENILAKDKSMLNSEEIGFLRARRSYLNDEQKKRFSDVLKGVKDTPEAPEGDDLDKMESKALKAVAKGMDLAVGGKVDELKARIREAREAKKSE